MKYLLVFLLSFAAFAQTKQWLPHAGLELMDNKHRTVLGTKLWSPFWQNQRSVFFGDFRLVNQNGAGKEFNFGAGLTHLFSSPLALRVQGFYDQRTSSHNFDYNQVTLGAEVLSSRFSGFGNAYLASDDCHSLGSSSNARVVNTQLLLGQNIECAAGGFDLGAKARLALGTKAEHLFQLGAKYFRFSADAFSQSLKGTQVGLDYFWLNPFSFNRSKLQVSFSYSDDSNNLRGNDDGYLSASVGIQIPLGSFFKQKGSAYRGDNLAHLTEFTTYDRDLDIVTPQKELFDLARDPEGEVINAYFVNSTSGEGTETDPMSLAEFSARAKAYDIALFVSDGVALDLGITSFSPGLGQQLIGVVGDQALLRAKNQWYGLQTQQDYQRSRLQGQGTRLLYLDQPDVVVSGVELAKQSSGGFTPEALIENDPVVSLGELYLHNIQFDMNFNGFSGLSGVLLKASDGARNNVFITDNSFFAENNSGFNHYAVSLEVLTQNSTSSTLSGTFPTVVVDRNDLDFSAVAALAPNGISISHYTMQPENYDHQISRNRIRSPQSLLYGIQYNSASNAPFSGTRSALLANNHISVANIGVTVNALDDVAVSIDHNLIDQARFGIYSSLGDGSVSMTHNTLILEEDYAVGIEGVAVRSLGFSDQRKYTIADNTLSLKGVGSVGMNLNLATSSLKLNLKDNTVQSRGNAVNLVSNTGNANNSSVVMEGNSLNSEAYALDVSIGQLSAGPNQTMKLKLDENNFQGTVGSLRIDVGALQSSVCVLAQNNTLDGNMNLIGAVPGAVNSQIFMSQANSDVFLQQNLLLSNTQMLSAGGTAIYQPCY